MSRHVEPLEWLDEMEIGDYSLDNHTKQFLRTANSFIDAYNSGSAEEYVDKTLNELSEYSHRHFPAQEELMERIEYPTLAEHKAEHKNFNIGVAKLLKKRLLLRRDNVPEDEFDERGMYGVITDLADFLTDWYHGHLKEADKRLSDYYNYEYKDL